MIPEKGCKLLLVTSPKLVYIGSFANVGEYIYKETKIYLNSQVETSFCLIHYNNKLRFIILTDT